MEIVNPTSLITQRKEKVTETLHCKDCELIFQVAFHDYVGNTQITNCPSCEGKYCVTSGTFEYVLKKLFVENARYYVCTYDSCKDWDMKYHETEDLLLIHYIDTHLFSLLEAYSRSSGEFSDIDSVRQYLSEIQDKRDNNENVEILV